LSLVRGVGFDDARDMKGVRFWGVGAAVTMGAWVAACGNITVRPADGGDERVGPEADASHVGAGGSAAGSGGAAGAASGGAGGGSGGRGLGGSSGPADAGAPDGGGGGLGGAGGAGACGTVEPCGGDIVGTWKLTEDCVNLAALQPAAQQICATARITSATAGVSGTLTFNADLTYTRTQTTTAIIDWSIPISCVSGLTCADFGALVQAGITAGETFTCTGTVSCSCQEAGVESHSESGTYALSGTDLTVVNDLDGSASSGGYCVQGGALHLVTVDATMSTGPMGQATIDEDVVAVRQ
jgi:hypothetical protein